MSNTYCERELLFNMKLPPPLTADEEKEAINKLKNGDPNIKQMLVEKNIRLVIYIAQNFHSTQLSFEDLVSIGNIGLIKAINTFDCDKDIKIATYATICIKNEILMALRKAKRDNRLMSVSLEEPFSIDIYGNELHIADIVGDMDVIPMEENEKYIEINEAVQSLDDKGKKIITLLYGFGDKEPLTQKETSKVLGFSQSYISRLDKKYLNKLKRKINEDETKKKGVILDMSKVDKEQLIQFCAEFGFNEETYKKVADYFNIKVSTVKYYISTWNIRKEVKKLNQNNGGVKKYNISDSPELMQKYGAKAETKPESSEAPDIITERVKQIIEGSPVPPQWYGETKRAELTEESNLKITSMTISGNDRVYIITEDKIKIESDDGDPLASFESDDVEDILKELKEVISFKNQLIR